MGFWRTVFGPKGYRPPTGASARPGQAFGVSIDPGTLYGVPSLDDYIYRTGRISRAEALRVPAVKRARDLICGEIGQFPLHFLKPDGKPADLFTPNLFQQPEPGVPPTVTWTRVIEDLLLYGRSWLSRNSVGWHGFLVDFHRLDAETVTVQPERTQTRWGTITVWPEPDGLLRIDSPNDGILASSPAVRACIALERATLAAVNGTPPVDYFTPEEDADPLDDTEGSAADPDHPEWSEVDAFLNTWAEKRRTSTTAYIPAAVKYNVAGWDPEKLQLADAREFAIKEVARLTGIDAEELSVSTTSRTYANMQDRRRHRIEDVLGPYMAAVEGRLSMVDVCPRGYRAAFDTAAFLRLDDLAAAQADALLITSRVLTTDEARAKRGLEPLGDQAAPDPADVNAALSAVHAIQTGRPLALPAPEEPRP